MELLREGLPIGFDRIGWKLTPTDAKPAFLSFCLPIGFDRIGWKL